jgi:hypothetical protein
MPDRERSWSAREVVAATDGLQAVRYQPVGPVSLKGLIAPITLSTAVRTG